MYIQQMGEMVNSLQTKVPYVSGTLTVANVVNGSIFKLGSRIEIVNNIDLGIDIGTTTNNK